MDSQKKLTEAKRKQGENVDQLNKLRQQFQQQEQVLLQAIIRLDERIKVYSEMLEENPKVK